MLITAYPCFEEVFNNQVKSKNQAPLCVSSVLLGFYVFWKDFLSSNAALAI